MVTQGKRAQELRAELRARPTKELKNMLTIDYWPAHVLVIVREVLFERGKK